MKQRMKAVACMLVATLALAGCGSENITNNTENETTEQKTESPSQGEAAVQNENGGSVTAGTEEYEGFLLDNVLHSEKEGDIHYNVYIPESYDGTEAYALYFTLPGYQGLYFQGVGTNVRTEDFGFTAREYNPNMIIVEIGRAHV